MNQSMKNPRRIILMSALLAAMSSGPVTGADIVPNYSITPLLSPSGEVLIPNNLNDHGDVVGFEDNISGAKAVVYSNGQASFLPNHCQTYGMQPQDINNHGTIVGSCSLYPQAIILERTENGGYERITLSVPYWSFKTASAINDNGEVIGTYQRQNEAHQAYLYAFEQGIGDFYPTRIGSFDISSGTDINAHGVVIGDSVTPQHGEGGSFLGGGHVTAGLYYKAINDHNQVVGKKNIQPGKSSAYGPTYDTNPEFWDVCGSSSADDINNEGIAVGTAYYCGSSEKRATLYTGDTIPIMLDDLIAPNSGWVLEEAKAINNAGQIVGVGQKDGVKTGFLLTPMPYTLGEEVERLSPLTDVETSTWNGKFTWSRKQEATEYRFALVDRSTDTKFAENHSPAALNCDSGWTCSLTPSTAIPTGEYSWHVRYEYADPDTGSSVWTDYSPGIYFSVNPQELDTDLIGPSGQVSGDVSLSWAAATNVEFYRVFLKNKYTQEHLVLHNYLPSEVQCENSDTCQYDAGALPAGTYYWSVRVRTAFGWKDFRPGLTFTVQ